LHTAAGLAAALGAGFSSSDDESSVDESAFLVAGLAAATGFWSNGSAVGFQSNTKKITAGIETHTATGLVAALGAGFSSSEDESSVDESAFLAAGLAAATGFWRNDSNELQSVKANTPGQELTRR
jgi:hypothetical protein